MNWHYTIDGQTSGPISDAEMQALRARGELNPDSLVWQEGWPDWRRTADVWPATQGTAPPPMPPQPGMTTCCAECGRTFPQSSLVPVAGALICETCKPLAVQKLQEGVALGGSAWRDGNLLVVRKGTPLPQRCIKCGCPSTHQVKKTLYWHNPFIYFVICAGVLVYLIVALIVRKNVKLLLPFCDACNSRRKQNILIGSLIFLSGIGLIFLAIYLQSSSSQAAGILAVIAFLTLLASAIWAIVVTIVVPKKIDDTHAWIKRVKPGFLDTLPEWRG